MMIRRIVMCGRLEGEMWTEWLKRATDRARQRAREAGLKEWPPEHFRRKWRWAGRIASSQGTEWTRKTTEWRDSAWQEAMDDMGSFRPRRPTNRRWMRFEDTLRRFCKEKGHGDWYAIAGNSAAWQNLTDDFVCWATDARFSTYE